MPTYNFRFVALHPAQPPKWRTSRRLGGDTAALEALEELANGFSGKSLPPLAVYREHGDRSERFLSCAPIPRTKGE
jgi:hypothetical protein